MNTSFSTVIVTRNRPAALSLSLPLHLTQSRLPERILVIDSSDDMSENRALVERIAATTSVSMEHQAAPRGMTVQRNIGLKQISSDVVFFPDDDSLLYPDALARMMHIYDRDIEGKIGGVCAVEAAVPPAGVLDGSTHASTIRPSNDVRARIAPWRTKMEDRLFPDPMKLAARRLQAALPPPADWLDSERAIWVEWMTGFRMSFRTSIVRKVGFNENLGDYALYEDIDAGLGVLAGGHSLVAAQTAQIYHHKAPENRTGGRQMGVINILNRAFVTMRSGVVDDALVKKVYRHAQFRIFQFRLGSRSQYGKERLAGALAAYNSLADLLASIPSDLEPRYIKVRNSCMSS